MFPPNPFPGGKRGEVKLLKPISPLFPALHFTAFLTDRLRPFRDGETSEGIKREEKRGQMKVKRKEKETWCCEEDGNGENQGRGKEWEKPRVWKASGVDENLSQEKLFYYGVPGSRFYLPW